MIDEKIALRCFAAMSYDTLRAYVTLLSLSLCITLLGANSLACASVCVGVRPCAINLSCNFANVCR